MNIGNSGYRFVDLGGIVKPGKAGLTCKVSRYFNEGTRGYNSIMQVDSHVGAHVEAPYHYSDNWDDITDIPFTSFMGRAVVLNLKCEPLAPITRKMLENADRKRLGPGDVAILESPYHIDPVNAPSEDKRPYLCKESAEWFVEKKLKCVAYGSAVATDYSPGDTNAFNELVMSEGILLLKGLRNIEQLNSDIFFIIFQPMPLQGLDACCVRPVAIEGIPGFS